MNGWSDRRMAGMHAAMAGHVEAGTAPGVVTALARHGRVEVSTFGATAVGGPPMRRDTIFRIASLTKPVTAVGALTLVEQCRLRLDEPIDPVVPELADRRVLVRPDGPLSETVPAERPITTRDLMTLTMGIGAAMTPCPIGTAMAETGVQIMQDPSPLTPDEWLSRLGELPLMHQPGAAFAYDVGTTVLGILVERISGQSLAAFLRERVLDPLRMTDTDFHVPAGKRDRLATSYRTDPATGRLQAHDGPAHSRFAAPPALLSGSGGLVSTAEDYLTFCRMLLAGGRHGTERILSRAAVDLMTSDQLTPAQRADAAPFLDRWTSWGLGLTVGIARGGIYSRPGRFGWTGGTGTSAYSDPGEDLVGILLTQRHMDSPEPARIFDDFWTSTYQALDD